MDVLSQNTCNCDHKSRRGELTADVFGEYSAPGASVESHVEAFRTE